MGIYPFFPDIKKEENTYFYVIFRHPTTGRPYISGEAYTKEEISKMEEKEILKIIPMGELINDKTR